MSWFRRSPTLDVESRPIRRWRIVTVMPDGTQWDLNGSVYSGNDPVVIGYVAAIADGLRRGGFDTQVEIIREDVGSL